MGESRRGGGDPKYVQVRGIRFKKQAFDFYKTNSYTNVCLKFLCDAYLITPFFYFLISGKNLKWKRHFNHDTIYSGITYFAIWLFGRAKYQGGDEAEAKDTDEQPLSDKTLVDIMWRNLQGLLVVI